MDLQTATSTSVLDTESELEYLRLLDLEVEIERRKLALQEKENLAPVSVVPSYQKAFIEAFPLHQFIRETFPIVEQGREFQDNWHISIISELLQAAVMRDIRDFIINIPRRCMKSTLVCVMFPCWVWTFLPHQRFLFTSYSAGFAGRDSKKCHELISSNYYQQRWGGEFYFTTEKMEKKLGNSKGGYRVVFKIGKGTGEGGDFVICLWYNTFITTNIGQLKIGDIVENKLDVKVLSFNHKTNTYAWQRIKKYEKSKGRKSVEIKFSNTKKIQCTFDHPFFVEGKGYVRACDLTFGDKVITDESTSSSIDVIKPNVTRSTQGNQIIQFVRPVLTAFTKIFNWFNMSRAIRFADFSTMETGIIVSSQNIQSDFAPILPVKKINAANPMRTAFSSKSSGKPRQPTFITTKSLFRFTFSRFRDFAARFAIKCRTCVCSTLHRTESFSFSNRNRHLRCFVASWTRNLNVVACTLQRAINSSFGFRLPQQHFFFALLTYLNHFRHKVLSHTKENNSNNRLRQGEQQSEQFNQSLSLPSRANARFGEQQENLQSVFVESIREIPVPESVYNIQISENHNYFANGILAHNCDDPNAIDEHESDTVLEKTNRGWNETSYNNVTDKRTAVHGIIQQRTAENDLTGNITEDSELKNLYVHLCLAMKFESDNPLANLPDNPLYLGTVSNHEKSSNNKLLVGEEKLWIDPRNPSAPDFPNVWYQEWYLREFKEKGLESRGDGQLLWENYMDENAIKKEVAHLKAYGEASQFQQRPIRRGGNFFDSRNFKQISISEVNLDSLILCRGWDKAGTEGSGDFTVGLLMARTIKRPFFFYILDIYRKQVALNTRRDKMIEIARQDTFDYIEKRPNNAYCIVIEKEGGSSGVDMATIERDDLIGYDAQTVPPNKEKGIRALPAKRASEDGRIKIVKGLWNVDFIRELERFDPKKKRQLNDQIDAFSISYKKLSSWDLSPSEPDSGFI